jgi:hypothetical protein
VQIPAVLQWQLVDDRQAGLRTVPASHPTLVGVIAEASHPDRTVNYLFRDSIERILR